MRAWKLALMIPFQSHAGSIEAVAVFPSPGAKASVSIPRWFD